MQFTAEMIATFLNGEIVGNKDTAVTTVSSIDGGKAGSLAYLTNPKYEQYIYTTEASIVLVDKTFEPKGGASGQGAAAKVELVFQQQLPICMVYYDGSGQTLRKLYFSRHEYGRIALPIRVT